MSSSDEISGLYDFLKSTGEGNLRKMLVGGAMTEVHLRLLLKIVRGCSLQDFSEHCEKDTVPKMNYSAAESKLKETFWKVCREVFMSRGLLSKEAATTPKAA